MNYSINKNKYKNKKKEYLGKIQTGKERYYIFFKSGEEIFYKNIFKNYVKWIPGRIIRRISKNLYEVEVNKVKRIAQTNQLRKGPKGFKFSPFIQNFSKNNDKNEIVNLAESENEYFSTDEGQEKIVCKYSSKDSESRLPRAVRRTKRERKNIVNYKE